MLLVKTIIHTILLPGSALVWIPLYILSSREELQAPAWDALALAGLVMGAHGLVVFVWCTLDFLRRGRGTPNPLDPPRLLVARGPYRYVRNPMYVAVVFMLLGEAAVFRSVALAVYSALVLACFHLFVVFYEEPSLSKRFGASYETYMREVPRWLPRFTRQDSTS